MDKEMTTVSKSQFAKICGVDKSRVSHWLADGKLEADALVGSGRRAMIDVEKARAQLRRNLDSTQMNGLNGLSTDLGADDATLAELIKAEKLAQERMKTSRMKAEAKLQEGIYMLAADAKGAFTRIARELFQDFEAFALQDLPAAVTAEFQTPHRELSFLARREFLAWRERASERHRAAKACVPEMVEVED
jgi:hypothetical protein